MVEIIENALQTLVTGTCLAISAFKYLQTKSRGWILLLLFYSELFLGDLYLQLYLLFFEGDPKFPFVSEFCWDVGFGFLILLVSLYSKGRHSIKKDPVLIIIPVFTVGFAIYYMTFGQIIDNIVVAFLMAVLILKCVYGLKSIDGKYAVNAEGPRAKHIYLTALYFCAAEYLSWTASCFFKSEDISNPYYWFDILLTIILIFFIPALKKCDTPEFSMLQEEGSL